MTRGKVRLSLQAAFTLQCFLLGCAKSAIAPLSPPGTPVGITTSESDNCPPPPPSVGAQHTVEIVEFGVAPADLEKYPELKEKRVGFGLAERLVQAVFDTGHFRLLEGTEEIVKRIATQWQAVAEGILTHPRRTDPNLLAAEFFLYVRVFDFVACSTDERIGPVTKQLSCRTSVGAQVRMVDPATLEYAPGSAEGSVTTVANRGLLGDASIPFEQTSVGQASQKAIQCALSKALQNAVTRGLGKGGTNS